MAEAAKYLAEAKRLREEAAREISDEYREQILEIAAGYDRLAACLEVWTVRPLRQDES